MVLPLLYTLENMVNIKNVLVTGSNGYIGSLLVPLLKQKNYKVWGLDTSYFDDPECHFKKTTLPDKFIKKDIRDIKAADLKNIDAVCHLAALSNDPLGEINPKLTRNINLTASQKLARFAKKVGVKRFLFSSSCSVYGVMGDQEITEESPVDPKTAYAVSKVEFEKSLLKLADKNFCPVILRNATAYGSSPKLRLDLVLNNFAASAFTANRINILSDGTPWRPMIHAEDIARLFVALLKAPTDKVAGQIINCGRNEENFQIGEIAKIVKSVFKKTEVSLAVNPDKDSRTYKVSFNKLKKMLPEFKFKWTLQKAVRQLKADWENNPPPTKVLTSRNFMRLRQLNYLIDNKRINQKLFWHHD